MPRRRLDLPATLLALLLAFTPAMTKPAFAGDLCPEFIGTGVMDVTAGDFDEDGFGDLAVSAAPPAKIALVFGQSGPRPTQTGGVISTGAAIPNLASGDFNNDGHVDLIGTVPGGFRVMLGSGTGTFAFGDPNDGGPAGVGRMRVADLNGDGLDDVAALGSSAVTILLADGLGGVAFSTTLAASGPFFDDLGVGDIDNDGDQDLVLLSHQFSGATALSLYLGDGTGSYGAPTATAVSSDLSALALGDLDEDGRADVVAAAGRNLGSGGAVFLGQAGGSLGAPTSFTLPAASMGGRTSLADLNADGHLDLVLMGAKTSNAEYFACEGNRIASMLGDGDGGLTSTGAPIVTTGSLNTQSNLATIDLNGDGRADAAVTGEPCGSIAAHIADAVGKLPAVAHPVRAFVDKNNGVIKLNTGKAWCVSFEVTSPAFDWSEIRSIELVSLGTGSVSSIIRDAAKPLVLADQDGNLVPDVRVCFTKDQLRQLFSNLQGRQAVTVQVAGDVGTPGCRFSGDLTIDVAPGGGNHAAAIRRDGDGATFSFRSGAPGPARLRIFDVNGRLLRTVESTGAGADWNDIRFDGRDSAGRRLASGVFFYAIDQGTERLSGKLVIAR